MKITVSITITGVLVLATIVTHSCKWPDYPPQVITDNVTEITYTSAVSGGEVTFDGGSSVYERGICWSTTINPENVFKNKIVNGSGTGSYVCAIENLKPGRRYYVWAYAINSVGTGFGYTVSFPTLRYITFNSDLTYDTVYDIGYNNLYKTIKIGTQTWMAENLKTMMFNDWSVLPYYKDATEWSNLTIPAFSLYENNDSTYQETFGVLYNFHAVNSSNICPVGWHVPSSSEWAVLENYLGGSDIAGGKLKETGNVNWLTPNTGATNESGFTALPGGFRSSTGSFTGFGTEGIWWLSDGKARGVLSDGITTFEADNNQKNGYSVRCIKD